MKLSTLKKMTQRRTSGGGHRMRWGAVYGRPSVPHLGLHDSNFGLSAACMDCGAEVTIGERGGSVIGEAVDSNCAASNWRSGAFLVAAMPFAQSEKRKTRPSAHLTGRAKGRAAV